MYVCMYVQQWIQSDSSHVSNPTVKQSTPLPHKILQTTLLYSCCHFQSGVQSDVNIVRFWSSLTQEGTEVTGTVWEVFKLDTNTLLCTNVNAYWHYSANRISAWRNGAQLQSYMGKLFIRSRDMAGVTLRVGVIVVCIVIRHM